MRSWFRWSLAGAAVVLVGIQLVPVDRSNPPVTADVSAPAHVGPVLRRACYDCHSNETVWPWYSRVAPVSWLVANDVHEGRAELNFSTWDRLGAEERMEEMGEIREKVAEGEMPPELYVLMHREAGLSPEDRSALRGWALPQ